MKVKITLPEDASHSVRVAVTSTTTGSDHQGYELSRDDKTEIEVDVEDEQKVSIFLGVPTPEKESEDASDKKD